MEMQEAVDITKEYLSLPQFVTDTRDYVNVEEIIALEAKRQEALKVLVYVAEKVIEGSPACP